MFGVALVLIIGVNLASTTFTVPSCEPDKNPECSGSITEAREYLKKIDPILVNSIIQYFKSVFTRNTNITEYNKNQSVAAGKKFAQVGRNTAQGLKKFQWNIFPDKDLVREATIIYDEFGNEMSLDDQKRLEFLKSELSSGFATAKICPYSEDPQENCNKTEASWDTEDTRDSRKLLYYWHAWRNETGSPDKFAIFLETAELMNKSAVAKGFKNLAEQWYYGYGYENIQKAAMDLYEQEHLINGRIRSIKRFYMVLHAYLRHKLFKEYISQGVDMTQDGLIPDHLMDIGWSTDDMLPYKHARTENITKILHERNYNATMMVRQAESFYEEMGFDKLPKAFWEKSLFEEPKNRSVDCQGTAWDFGPEDQRLTYCLDIRETEIYWIHQMMGHSYYFIAYAPLPAAYRIGTNPAFHQGVGDAIALTTNTRAYRKKMGLTSTSANGKVGQDEQMKSDMNYLMKLALRDIPDMPSVIVEERLRWALFSGKIKKHQVNEYFWQLQEDIRGIKSPGPFSGETQDYLNNFHMTNFVSLMRYFFSTTLKFQLYGSLCVLVKDYDPYNPQRKPLHQCDFSGNPKLAGKKLKHMMEKGGSEDWRIILKEMTGEDHFSSEYMMRYFDPIITYLEEENRKVGAKTGWVKKEFDQKPRKLSTKKRPHASIHVEVM